MLTSTCEHPSSKGRHPPGDLGITALVDATGWDPRALNTVTILWERKIRGRREQQVAWRKTGTMLLAPVCILPRARRRGEPVDVIVQTPLALGADGVDSWACHRP